MWDTRGYKKIRTTPSQGRQSFLSPLGASLEGSAPGACCARQTSKPLCISVVNRINADKDFIQVADPSFKYTITRPTRFSEITTSITNPDGSLASTDDGNCVIYRITKKGNLDNFNIIQQILQEGKSKK